MHKKSEILVVQTIFVNKLSWYDMHVLDKTLFVVICGLNRNTDIQTVKVVSRSFPMGICQYYSIRMTHHGHKCVKTKRSSRYEAARPDCLRFHCKYADKKPRESHLCGKSHEFLLYEWVYYGDNASIPQFFLA